MKISIFLFILFISLNSNAISIVGRVVDTQSKEPIEGVSLILTKNDSTIIDQVITHKDGSFAISTPAVGDFLLMISYLNYQSLTVSIKNIQEKSDLGTIELSVSNILLDEIIVTPGDYTKVDRQIVYPSLETIADSFTGLEVIGKLMLPGILVDASNNSISSITKRPVQLRINDVPADMNEILSVNPKRIIKVEYIDLPGVRYGEVGAVINIVLKRSEQGFSTGGNIRTGLTTLYLNDMVNIKYNNKLSEFGVTYNFVHWNFTDCYKDEHQIFQLPDNRLEISKTGIKSPSKTINNNIVLSYNWNNYRNTFFNLIFRNNIEQPNSSANQLINDDLNKITYSSHLNTKNKNYSPALDIYYQRSLDEKQTFTANAVTTYISSDYNRLYHEFDKDSQLKDDFSYDVTGKKYSLLSEFIYENRFNNTIVFTAGLKYSQAYIENTYSGSDNGNKNSMNTSDIYGYVQLSGSLKKLAYQLGVGYSKQAFDESIGNYSKNFFRPSLTLSYSPKENTTFRFNSYVMPYIPILSDLSDFRQWQNKYEVFIGNPNLKPCNSYANILIFNYRKGRISLSPTLYYQLNPNYIMSTIERFEDNGEYYFEYSNSNQKGFRHLQGRMYLTAELIKDRLFFTATGAVNRYFNFGGTYTHLYTGYYGGFQLEGNYKNWSVSSYLNIESKSLFNETLFIYSPTAYVNVRYRYKNFQYGLEIINPFLPDGNPNKQKLISKYVMKESSAFNKNYGNMVRFTIAWNLDFGRKYNSKQKQIFHEDNDTGIVK